MNALGSVPGDLQWSGGRWMRAALVGCVLGLLPAGAAADLTGTWEGKVVCREFDGVRRREVMRDQTLAMTQQGSQLRIEWLSVATFDGTFAPDAKKPDKEGDLMAVACLNDGDLTTGAEELVRLTAKLKSDGVRGSLKGTSFLALDGTHLATCKWRFNRVSDEDPDASRCP
jgi:hypothetical protein